MVMNYHCKGIVFFLPLIHRGPIQVKRPNSGAKPQRKDSPAMQHKGPMVRGQVNPKTDKSPRNGRGTKARDEKVM